LAQRSICARAIFFTVLAWSKRRAIDFHSVTKDGLATPRSIRPEAQTAAVRGTNAQRLFKL
jgi:hypothetical protein